jgi:hypothetical protein
MSCCWNQFSRRAARLVWLAPATRRGGRRAQSTLRSLAYARRRTQTPTHRLKLRFWSWRRDLNPRPSDYKSDALPAELRQPAWFDPPRADFPRHNSTRQPGQSLSLAQRHSACKQAAGYPTTSDNAGDFDSLLSPQSRKIGTLGTPTTPTGKLAGILRSAFVIERHTAADLFYRKCC